MAIFERMPMLKTPENAFLGKRDQKSFFLGILVLKLTEFFFWKNTTKKIFFGNFSVKIDRIFLGEFLSKEKILVLEKCPQSLFCDF